MKLQHAWFNSEAKPAWTVGDSQVVSDIISRLLLTGLLRALA